MALKYIFEDKIDQLCAVTQAYHAWYASFLPSVLYPDNKDFQVARTALPQDVLVWLDAADPDITTPTELSRTEQEEALFHLGIDKATGLRSRAVISSDLERELDRFQRQGLR